MNDIVIFFNPFEISGDPEEADSEHYRFQKDGKKVIGVDTVELCSLPDILYEEKSRRFVGLSFFINHEYKNTIQKLVKNIANHNCRYISMSDSNNTRYKGFGDNDRFEIYWSNPDGEVVCEMASLFEGVWLYVESDIKKKNITKPYGFWLSLVDDIKDTHKLI